MDKILIIYGSLNSVPSPEGAAPAKVIVDTVKHLDTEKFEVLSNYNKNLKILNNKSSVFKYVKANFTDKMILFLLKLRYRFQERKVLFTTAEDFQLLYFIAASRYVRRNNYKKVIVHVSTGMVEMIKFFNSDCKIVFYHHGTSLHSKQSEAQWQKLLNNTVAIFGVNQAAADFANAHFKTKLPSNFYFKIGNGVDKAPNILTSSSPNDIFQILFSGRICKEKGVLELIRAYKILKDKNYNIVLNIVGDVGTRRGLEAGSQYLDRCVKYVSDNNLNVNFPGFLKGLELYKMYEMSNIIVLPTDPTLSSEGMSLSLIEGMSMGKPLIATNIGGNPEIIGHGVNGFLIYKAKDYASEIADRIEEIFLDSDLACAMSDSALKKYNKYFTTKIMSNNFYIALQKINYV